MKVNVSQENAESGRVVYPLVEFHSILAAASQPS